MSIDAYVQVALIEKAKRVFVADPNVFLSFPLLTPLAYKPEAFAALATPASASELAFAADFARTMNFLPRDIVASGLGDRFLWDVYGDVLTRAEVAKGDGPGSGASSATLLYEIAPDGSRTESAVYRAYRQYRDAWIVAREDYGAHKVTGEMTNNPDVARHWTEVEEPALRAVLAKAEDDWKTLGHRVEVEAALQAERDAAARDPGTRWREWSGAFNPDIDVLTELTGSHYAPTGLSPTDFTADAAWLRSDLSSDEIAHLVAEAAAPMKALLDGVSASAVANVSFEYRSVAVVRPWFQSSVLTSRIWRSSDPELGLSDGADPPAGACPGYVTGVVFARNVVITSRDAPTPTPGTVRFTLPPERLVLRQLAVPVARPVLPAAEVRPTASADTERAFARLRIASVTSAPTLVARPVPARAALQPQLARMAPETMVRADIARPPLRPIPRRPPPILEPLPTTPSQPQPPPPERHEEISVLAFICKRLPKTPDPLPDLHWT